MSEIPKPLSPEETLQAVRDEQNAIEGSLRESFLRKNFVHPYGNIGNSEEESRLLDQFMAEKVGKDMCERFQMAVSEDYFSKIHVVELGSAKAPFTKVSIEDLKREYHALVKWLVRREYTPGEIPRNVSDRQLEVRIPSDVEIARERIVIIRTRPLIDGFLPMSKPSTFSPDWHVDYSGMMVQVGIAKRMVFSMPTQLYQGTRRAAEELAKRADLDPNAIMLQVVEAMLDRNDKQIDPIRTGYYLSTDYLA